MKVGKPTSKRVPVRLRHKIQKASAAKQRKNRKEAKKNPQWRSRLKKDPGIPNLFPFKDKILAEVEETRRRKEEEAQKRRETARAQRNGTAVPASTATQDDYDDKEDEDDELMDPEDDGEEESGDEMDTRADENPMAALVASAQARAQTFGRGKQTANTAAEDDAEAPDDDELDAGVVLPPNQSNKSNKATLASTAAQTAPTTTNRPLPKQALADPIKAVTKILARVEATPTGIQDVLDFYAIPPLVTAGSDATTRFLVDVARKKGRLGRGGIPNLHSAALAFLSDIHDGRLKLPSLSTAKPQSQATQSTQPIEKGEVQIVTQMAEPFRIEGLYGDSANA